MDRLISYRRGPRTLDEALAYYAWNTALCESLYPCLNSFEIALRNSMHNAISQASGSPQWYTEAAGIVQPQDERFIEEAMEDIQRLGKPVTAPYVVATLNFGFWTTLFDRRYERIIWPGRARTIFPHIPVQELQRTHLSGRVNRIRKLRNRVFHFEPLWHWADLADHHTFVLESIGYINPAMRVSAELFDRFPEVHSLGVTPYRDGINNYLATLPPP